MADQFNLDAGRLHSIEALTESLGWRVSVTPDFGRRDRADDRPEESLRRRHYVRGRAVRRSFSQIIDEANPSTVRVECDGERVALGCVVNADGWILTKASQMTGKIKCLLHDGRAFSARVVGTDLARPSAATQEEGRGKTGVLSKGRVGFWRNVTERQREERHEVILTQTRRVCHRGTFGI